MGAGVSLRFLMVQKWPLGPRSFEKSSYTHNKLVQEFHWDFWRFKNDLSINHHLKKVPTPPIFGAGVSFGKKSKYFSAPSKQSIPVRGVGTFFVFLVREKFVFTNQNPYQVILLLTYGRRRRRRRKKNTGPVRKFGNRSVSEKKFWIWNSPTDFTFK